jgi:hypothetical protein
MSADPEIRWILFVFIVAMAYLLGRYHGITRGPFR